MQKLGIPLGPRMRIMQEWQQRLERQQTPQPQHSQQTQSKFKSHPHLNSDSYSIYAIVWIGRKYSNQLQPLMIGTYYVIYSKVLSQLSQSLNRLIICIPL